MGFDFEAVQSQVDAFAVDDGILFGEPIESARRRDEMRFFLVACLQASVSIETMSRHLGIDTDIVRTELLAGIEAWNAAQRRHSEPAFEPPLSIVSSRG